MTKNALYHTMDLLIGRFNEAANYCHVLDHYLDWIIGLPYKFVQPIWICRLFSDVCH